MGGRRQEDSQPSVQVTYSKLKMIAAQPSIALTEAFKEEKVGRQKLFQGRRKRRKGKAMKKWEVVRAQASITQPLCSRAGMCTLHVFAPVW